MQVDSYVSEVTVYSDRALVSRRGKARLGAGTHQLRLSGLPMTLDPDSVRVRGEGDAEAILHGFDLKTIHAAQGTSEQAIVLENMLLALADEDRGLADGHAIQSGKYAALQQTMQHTAGSFAHQLAEGRAKLDEWEDTLGFLDAQQARASSAMLELERRRRDVARRRSEVEAELQVLRSFRGSQTYEAVVTVEIASEGDLALIADYVCRGASWVPAYDARLSQAGDRLEWRYYGLVRQQTGEHWNDVRLKLSTARPAESSRPPLLEDWHVSAFRPEPQAPMLAPSPRNEGAMPQAPPAPPPASRASAPVATVTEQGTSVTMEVARPLTIPSNGEPLQASVGRFDLSPNLDYFVIPKLVPHVYLEVEATYEAPWPLLPGPVKAFVGQDFVGTIPLGEEVIPGSSFRLPMGVDRALQVERKRLKKLQGEGGLIKKERYTEYQFEVVLANHKDVGVSVTLIEPVPRASQDEIKIKLGESTMGAQQDEPGRLSWVVQLLPRQRQKVTWGYRVEYPTTLTVTGLE